MVRRLPLGAVLCRNARSRVCITGGGKLDSVENQRLEAGISIVQVLELHEGVVLDGTAVLERSVERDNGSRPVKTIRGGTDGIGAVNPTGHRKRKIAES